MKYFGIYNNSGDVQTALAEFALAKPYVAIVSGALDYDSQRAPRTAPYIVDSLGNEYEGIDNEYYWSFEFTKPLSATFTLYSQDENVVTATTLQALVYYTCNGEEIDTGDTIEENYAVQNFNLVPPETSSSSTITVMVTYNENTNEVIVSFKYEDCDLYNKYYNKITCIAGGGCWDEDNQECGECPVGVWSNNGAGRYTLTILDEYSQAWNQYDGEHQGSIIANASLYVGGLTALTNLDIWLSSVHAPRVKFSPTSGYQGEDDYIFYSGSETQNTNYRVARTDYVSTLYIEWDEDEKTLTFYSGSENNPLSMTTYDVENPDA